MTITNSMLSIISRSLQFVFGALLPIQITLEVIYLSKDWPIPMLETASYALQQQREKLSLQILLLKYWTIYGLVYLILPNSPLYFIFHFVPFESIILSILQLISLNEILKQFTKFIEEQDKIIAFLQNLDGSSKNKFSILSNIIFTTINLNNKEYIATNFLFGDYTRLLIMYTRTLKLPQTNYIDSVFDSIIQAITIVKLYIQREQENYEKFNRYKWDNTNAGGENHRYNENTNTSKDDWEHVNTSNNQSTHSETFHEVLNRFCTAFKQEYNRTSARAQTQPGNPQSPSSSTTSSAQFTEEQTYSSRKNTTSDDYEIIDNDLD